MGVLCRLYPLSEDEKHVTPLEISPVLRHFP